MGKAKSKARTARRTSTRTLPASKARSVRGGIVGDPGTVPPSQRPIPYTMPGTPVLQQGTTPGAAGMKK
jgi:hypothetical protein